MSAGCPRHQAGGTRLTAAAECICPADPRRDPLPVTTRLFDVGCA